MSIKQSNLWDRIFRNKGSDGFTIVEIAIVIPLIAITGGFVMMLMVQSIQTSAKSAAMVSASTSVNSVTEEINNATNCYELRNSALTEFTQPSGRKNIMVEVVRGPNDDNPSKPLVCKAGQETEMIVKAYEKGDPDKETLYKRHTTVFISE